jgi:hypothetical protein
MDKARTASLRSEVQIKINRSIRKSGTAALRVFDFIDVQHNLNPDIGDAIWSGCIKPFPNENQSLKILLWGVINRRLR